MAPYRDVPMTRRRALVLIAASLAGVLTVAGHPSAPGAPVAAAAGASSFRSITPHRVVDTRHSIGATRLGPGGTATVDVVTPEVAAAAGLSEDDISAVAINVTMVDAAGAGYLTTWPTNVPQPTASSLNTRFAGHIVANLVTVPVSPGGGVSFFTDVGGHLVVDVQGVFVPSATSTVGRLVPLSPRRAVDTRRPQFDLDPGTTRVVDLGPVGVPDSANAVVLNVTLTEATSPGFVTVWQPGAAQPLASNLNVVRAGQTVANQVFAPVTRAEVAVFADGGGHLIIDVAGYFTGPDASPGSDGLFVPLSPERLLDTRQPGSPTGARPVGAGRVIDVPVAGRAGVPASGVAAVAFNVTATQGRGIGYVTAWPALTSLPDTSTLNTGAAGETVANHAVTTVSTAGVGLYTFADTHLIADVTGYWTGNELAVGTQNPPGIPAPPGPQPPSPPTVGPHAFLYRTDSGGFARWNPCSTIGYVVNDERATRAQRVLLDESIAEVEAATGLDFAYAGETSAGLDGKPPPGVEAVLTFADSSSSTTLGSSAGIGGGRFRQSGEVVEGYSLFAIKYGTQSIMRTVILHELGHMVGLAHVDEPSQVLYPNVQPSSAYQVYQPGDREGLWRLGSAQGCTGAARLTDTSGDAHLLDEASSAFED
jgi:hypothetical protein